jgi:NitT/TauT family transport system permease protein
MAAKGGAGMIVRDPLALGVSVTGFVLFWSLMAFLKADPLVLPGPMTVGLRIFEELTAGRMVEHVAMTLQRVAAAFAIAMLAGGVIGLALGLHRRLDAFADAWVVIFLNLPALVLIVLCYLWIGLNEIAAVTAVALNKAAMVIVTVREGARTFDPALNDMARIFRLTRSQRFAHVMLPQLAPFIAAAARNGLAMIWKVVLVVEFLGRSNGVGYKIHLDFQMFDTTGVLAYAISFVAIMLLIEYVAIQPIERRANQWRGTDRTDVRAQKPVGRHDFSAKPVTATTTTRG